MEERDLRRGPAAFSGKGVRGDLCHGHYGACGRREGDVLPLLPEQGRADAGAGK